MRLLADLQISSRTVGHLRALGHDVVRVTDLLPATASDETIADLRAGALVTIEDSRVRVRALPVV